MTFCRFHLSDQNSLNLSSSHVKIFFFICILIVLLVFSFYTTNIYEAEEVWKRCGQVIKGDWDGGNGVGEPVLMYEGNPLILTGELKVFKLWFHYAKLYNGINYHQVRYAESINAINWNISSIAILNTSIPTTRPFVFKLINGTYYMVCHYEGKTQYGLWRSIDGLNFTLLETKILLIGEIGQWDDRTLGNMFVLYDSYDGKYKMLYEAVGTSNPFWDIGYAESWDLVNWNKSDSNPIIDGGVGMRGGPHIEKVGSTWYMWAHDSVSANLPTDIVRSSSSDLLNWIDDLDGNIVFSRTETWEGWGSNTGQVADISLVEVNGFTYMIYSALPNQTFINGSFGLAIAPLTLSEIIFNARD